MNFSIRSIDSICRVTSIPAARSVVAWIVAVVVMVSGQAAQAQLIPYNPRVERGATVGGVTGAVIGGIIGKQNDETVEGALIGGAVGAITGGMVGHAQNQRDAEMRAAQQRAYDAGYRSTPNYYQQRQYQPSPVPQRQPVATYYQNRPVRQPVGIADVVAMTRRGFPDRLIIQHIQLNGVRSVPTTEELLKMYDEGVSTEVIEAMQEYVLTQEGTVLPTPSLDSVSTQSNSSAPALLAPTPAPRPQVKPQARTTYRRRY